MTIGTESRSMLASTITRYVYDGEDILFEFDGSNALKARYTHGPGIDEPLLMDRGGTKYSYHSDGLGSIMDLTDSTGAVKQSYVYDSFGQIVQTVGSVTNPYTYTGREFDSESGLYYYRFRHYDPRIGRFLQEDPIGFWGGDLNLYNYVWANPINYVDPFGLLVHEGFIKQLTKYTSKQLKKAIKSLEKQIEKHKNKLADISQQQSKQHHEHEIKVFQEQLRLAEEEAAKRNITNTSAAIAVAGAVQGNATTCEEDVSQEEAEGRTGSWIDWIDPDPLGTEYAY